MSQPLPPGFPQQPPPAVSALDGLVPTNPLAALSCWSGIFSLLFCFFGPLLGPLALITGIISLKKGAMIQQSGYGKATSTARSWIGIVTGALGTVVGIVVLVMAILDHHR